MGDALLKKEAHVSRQFKHLTRRGTFKCEEDRRLTPSLVYEELRERARLGKRLSEGASSADLTQTGQFKWDSLQEWLSKSWRDRVCRKAMEEGGNLLRMALEPTSGKAGSAMLSVQCDRGFGVDDVSATSDFRAFNAVVTNLGRGVAIKLFTSSSSNLVRLRDTACSLILPVGLTSIMLLLTSARPGGAGPPAMRAELRRSFRRAHANATQTEGHGERQQ